MKTKMLECERERVEQWPPEFQDELAQIALEMDLSMSGGVYHATDEERADIDKGIRAANEGRFATEQEVQRPC